MNHPTKKEVPVRNHGGAEAEGEEQAAQCVEGRPLAAQPKGADQHEQREGVAEREPRLAARDGQACRLPAAAGPAAKQAVHHLEDEAVHLSSTHTRLTCR